MARIASAHPAISTGDDQARRCKKMHPDATIGLINGGISNFVILIKQ